MLFASGSQLHVPSVISIRPYTPGAYFPAIPPMQIVFRRVMKYRDNIISFENS